MPEIPTMAEAYSWCGITPAEYLDYTPAELEMMLTVQKYKAGYEGPRQSMTNPEMEAVCKTIQEAMNLKEGS